MATRTGPPLYVEYGGLATTPQPDLVEDCVLYGFFPKARRTNLQSLCDKVFAVPSKGAVKCIPLLDRVMLTFGRAARIRPRLKQFNKMGYATEQQVAFWIPVRVQRNGGRPFPNLAWFVPYMWVDNPLSLCGGREIFGWAKNWGSMIVDPQKGFTLQAYGGNYDPGLASDYFPLIEMTPVSAAASKPRDKLVPTVLEWLFNEAAVLLEKEFHGLFDRFVRVSTPVVFLKQFRSVSNGLEASVQEITGAETKVTQFKTLQLLLTKYRLTIHRLDSHRITSELGVIDQTLSAGFKITMDFALQNGITLWP